MRRLRVHGFDPWIGAFDKRRGLYAIDFKNVGPQEVERLASWPPRD